MKVLLSGKELFLKREFIEDLRHSAFPNGDSAGNIREFTAKKDDLVSFFDFCRTAPFLAEQRLAILWEVDSLKADEKKSLAENFPGLPKSAIVVLVSEESAKKDGFLKELSEVADKSMVFYTPFEKDFPGWIEARARKKGKQIGRRGIELLLERVGRDLVSLDLALEELAVYTATREGIEEADVRALLGKSVQQDVFALVDLLLERDARASLGVLRDLFREGVRGPEILAVLSGQFDRLRKGVDLLAQGQPPERVGAELRIHSFFLQKYLRQTSKISKDGAKKIRRQLLSCDESIKSGRLNEAIALEKLVLELCA